MKREDNGRDGQELQEQQRQHSSCNKRNNNNIEKVERSSTLYEVFQKYDTDSSGLLSIEELKVALQDAGRPNVTVGEIHTILRDKMKKKGVAIGNATEISLQDFQTLYDESQLYEIFQQIDVDDSGSITIHELANAFQQNLNIQIPESKLVRLLFDKVDEDLNGRITYLEFQSFFHHMPMATLRSITKSWSNLISDGGIDIGSDLVPPQLNDKLSTSTSEATSRNMPLYRFLWAGGLGGIFSRTITAPLEVVKLRAQINSNYKGMVEEWKYCLRKQGLRGLFVGNMTNCLRIFPHAGIGCVAYSRYVQWLPSDHELDRMEFVSIEIKYLLFF